MKPFFHLVFHQEEFLPRKVWTQISNVDILETLFLITVDVDVVLKVRLSHCATYFTNSNIKNFNKFNQFGKASLIAPGDAMVLSGEFSWNQY